jgi:hypothetical protein
MPVRSGRRTLRTSHWESPGDCYAFPATTAASAGTGPRTHAAGGSATCARAQPDRPGCRGETGSRPCRCGPGRTGAQVPVSVASSADRSGIGPSSRGAASATEEPRSAGRPLATLTRERWGDVSRWTGAAPWRLSSSSPTTPAFRVRIRWLPSRADRTGGRDLLGTRRHATAGLTCSAVHRRRDVPGRVDLTDTWHQWQAA